MRFDNEQLKLIISGEPVGVAHPYDTKNEETIEDHILDLFESLKKSNSVDCFGEFDHYGSGYASYVEIFCVKKGGRSIIQKETKKYYEKDDVWVTSTGYTGVVLYVNRLAPVVIFSKDERYKEKNESVKARYSYETFSKNHSFAELSEDFGKLPFGDWDNEFNEIQATLKKYGYSFLEKEYLEQELPFKADIPTLLCIPDLGGKYKIFDSLFYWSD